MNIARNMEAIFLIALALSCASAYAAVPTQHVVRAPHAAAANAAAANKMAVVTVSAKRLTAAQKARLVD